ncbi:protein phosphatase 1F [Xenopus tropicalis]|uniref:Protein phosphatase 1F n=1 Tax=Xenopus tropicalis TaxID=8364 RepID=F6X7Z2_XENTR|nr:protein phosphatase 1F [Xenopus tropicalis]|eukprot:XP_002931930.1 PREDICTED: protein phosphatase 1F [Xenopus tropicalis]
MELEDGALRECLLALQRHPPGQDEQLRPQSRHVSQAEAEGELTELLLKLLGSRVTPSHIAAFLTQSVVHKALQGDLSSFAKKNETQTTENNEENEQLLCSESLCHYCLQCLQEVISQWLEQLPPLPPPPHELCVSVHAIRNTRRKMEDRHVILQDFNMLFGIKDSIPRSYFAVFDGHGGVDAANYASTYVHVNVARHEGLEQDPAQALRESFQRTDAMFLKKAKREIPRLRSGTTGVCILLEGDRFHVAWLGDSQALLVRQGNYVTLMDPHKPERKDERERIESLGGCVAFMGCWRVNGTLAVSRAIGDIDQKPFVSGEGDVTSHILSGTEDFLVLACDGFYDTVSPPEVPRLVFDYLQENGGNWQHVAERLVTVAKEGGSSDNITVVVVFLKHPQKLLEDIQAQGSVEGQALFDFGGEAEEVASDHAG